MTLDKKTTCWIIGEGLAGTENQCRGIAQALGLDPVIKRIQLRQPWKTLSPMLGFEQWWSFDPLLTPPWPDLVLAAGRKGIAPTRYIRKASDGKSYVVFLQNPHCDLNDFDLVAAPAHDELKGKNVITLTGAPNRITKSNLDNTLKEFPAITALPGPRIAVLIGGNSKTHQITDTIIDKLISDLKKLDGSLMITASRRTPEAMIDKLRKAFDDQSHIFWAGEQDGPNPYMAYLAAADHIIATGDSVSMLSDAGTTGKPVHMVELEGGSPKFTRLYEAFKKDGVMRPFTGKLDNWDYEPLNEAAKVANAIEQAMKRDNEQRNKTQ